MLGQRSMVWVARLSDGCADEDGGGNTGGCGQGGWLRYWIKKCVHSVECQENTLSGLDKLQNLRTAISNTFRLLCFFMQINRIWIKFARREYRIEHMVGQHHKLGVKYWLTKFPIILDMSTLIVLVNLRHKSWKEGIIQQLPSYSFNIDA